MDAKKAAGYFTDGEVPDARTTSRRPRAAACDGSAVARLARVVRCCPPAADPRALRATSPTAVDRRTVAPFPHRSRAPRRGRRASSRASRASGYPDLAIPYHSRWRHFEAGGVDRRGGSNARCRTLAAERARAHRPRGRQRAARRRRRSGMALRRGGDRPALHALRRARRRELPRVRATARSPRRRAIRFASMPRRWPPSTRRRSARCSRCATTIRSSGSTAAPRCCDGWARALATGAQRAGRRSTTALTRDGRARSASTPPILRALLDMLGPIWLTGSALDGVALGDAWQHPHAGGDGPTRGLGAVPQAVAVARRIRCSSRSNGPASTVTDRDALTGAARVSQRRAACSTPACSRCATPRTPPPRGTSAASSSSSGAR